MKISFKKAVISIGTAIVMVTSVFAGTVVAATTNEITVQPSAFSVNAGEAFDVSVGFKAGDNGAAGFQLNLHYDSKKLDVYVPSEAEIQGGKYNYQVLGSRFLVTTNYSYSDGVVRIVGVNGSGNNIIVDTPLSVVTFIPKEGASGKAAFWIEVEKLSESKKNGEFVSSSYSAPSSSSPVYVDLLAPATVTQTTTTTTQATTTPSTTTTTTNSTTTTAEVTTTPKPVTTTPAPTTTEAVTTTEKSETTTASPTTTTPKKTEAAASQTTEKTTLATTTPEVTTAPITSPEVSKSDTSAEISAVPEDTPEVTTVESSETAAVTESPDTTEPSGNENVTTDGDAVVIENDEPLYQYSQGASEYNEEEVEPYCVDLKDYIDDFDKPMDIKVSVESDGFANGSISMNDPDGNWVKYYQDTQANVWEAKNVSLDRNDALVFVQLFYLQENSSFAINKIEITPSKADAQTETEEIKDGTENSGSDNKETIEQADPEKIEEIVNEMPENDKNPNTSDSFKSVMAISLVILEVTAMAAVLFFTGRKKVIEEPKENAAE